jgi:asparagine synthase (glutamine-hydrolysing)
LSGICGIINWNGEAVHPAQLMKMAVAAAYRGPDGIKYYIKKNIGMVHLALHTTTEGILEKQPIASKDQKIILVGDIRLDNRDDIIQRLGSISEYQHEVIELKLDAYILLAAYQRWRETCLDYIYGDFSFAIWDSVERYLFAAVDHQSKKSLHFYNDRNALFFSTEAHQILTQPSVSCRINEFQIARDLVSTGRSGIDQSYFANINKIRPAHYLSATAQKQNEIQYWDIKIPTPIRYKNIQDYSEHFLEIFGTCVDASIRSQQLVSVLLSGGLDSSSIFALAAQSAQQKSNIAIEALSFHVQSKPEITETALSHQTARIWGKPHKLVVLDSTPLIPYQHAHLVHPDSAVAIPWISFLHQARTENPTNRVWLTGIDGDSKNGIGNPIYYLELLNQGKIFPLVSTLYRHKTQYQVSWKWLLWNFIVDQLFVNPLRASVRPYKQKIFDRFSAHQSLICLELMQKAKIFDWLKSLPSQSVIPSISAMKNPNELALDFRWRLLSGFHSNMGNLYFDRIGSTTGLEFRHPWNDIRLINFFLAIPQNLIAEGLDRKILLQEAMKGLLPEPVRQPSGLKTGVGYWVAEAAKHLETQEVLENIKKNSPLLKTGWIRNEMWEAYISEIQSGQRRISISSWYPITLSIWLSNLKGSFF